MRRFCPPCGLKVGRGSMSIVWKHSLSDGFALGVAVKWLLLPLGSTRKPLAVSLIAVIADKSFRLCAGPAARVLLEWMADGLWLRTGRAILEANLDARLFETRAVFGFFGSPIVDMMWGPSVASVCSLSGTVSSLFFRGERSRDAGSSDFWSMMSCLSPLKLMEAPYPLSSFTIVGIFAYMLDRLRFRYCFVAEEVAELVPDSGSLDEKLLTSLRELDKFSSRCSLTISV
jgi:hypothetical protein